MQKVSLYIRNHSTRCYEKVRPKALYPMGTILCSGAAAATALFRGLVPALPIVAPDLLVPHGSITKE